MRAGPALVIVNAAKDGRGPNCEMRAGMPALPWFRRGTLVATCRTSKPVRSRRKLHFVSPTHSRARCSTAGKMS